MITTEPCYQLGDPPVQGFGVRLAKETLTATLKGPVSEIVYDGVGQQALAALVEGLPETDFERSRLAEVLSDGSEPEDWRVGEALAEHYLTEACGCYFPWPDSRDERKRKSSLPGADLVGFQSNSADGERFAFGEVKTSTEPTYPPGLCYGRHGLKQQLEDLQDNQSIRDQLTLYLAYRATGAAWQDRFKRAFKQYLANTSAVSVFGILVRDVSPHENDIKARVIKLGESCPGAMRIDLIAIYLPNGAIASLPKLVIPPKASGGAA